MTGFVIIAWLKYIKLSATEKKLPEFSHELCILAGILSDYIKKPITKEGRLRKPLFKERKAGRFSRFRIAQSKIPQPVNCQILVSSGYFETNCLLL